MFHVHRCCCINRARSVDVYAQRSLGQPPIKSDSRVTASFNCLILSKKIRKDIQQNR
ncbi:MAG: hypothetical protein V3Q69_00320 [Burkholderia sp.]